MLISDTNTIKALSDSALLERLQLLSAKENETTVEILLHLAEVDERRLHLSLKD